MLFILFFLVSRHSVVMSSNGCHSDRDKDHRPRVSCVTQGLTAVPDGIDPGTQTLVLSQNALDSLSWANYTIFTQLHELDLSQNLISTIDQSGPVMNNLRVLRLTNNTLTCLGGGTFKSTPSLMEIYLDGNTISSLDNEAFRDLPNLEVINLSRNKLHILPPHLLQHISSSGLKHFDLEENHVQHLPDDFFTSKPELPYVYLSKNDWVCTCQVSYLQRYLDDQGHNVYKHTGALAIENAVDSVVCSAPPRLQGQAIVDLSEEEYCSSHSDSPLGDMIPLVFPTTTLNNAEYETPSISIELKSMNPTTIPAITTEPATQEGTTSITNTPRYTSTAVQQNTPTEETSATTTPKIIESSTTPGFTSLTNEKSTTTTTSTTIQPTTPITTDPTTSINITPTTSQTTFHPTTPETAKSKTTPVPTTLATNNPTTSNAVTTVAQLGGEILSAHADGQHSVPWCWWLFITVLLLCIFSAIFSSMLFLWLIIAYIKLYQPIKRHIHGRPEVTLKAYQATVDPSPVVGRHEAERVPFLPREMIRETQPVFRSVLFISKGDEDGESDEWREGMRNKNEEKKRETAAVTKIDLLPAVTLHRERETEAKDREEVFRKTLYRVISREEEIEGWKEVEENCWMEERDKARKEEELERGKTRYSLILREERGSLMEDKSDGTEWLVGEWEMRGGVHTSLGSLMRMKEGGGLSDSTHMDTTGPVAETSV
ncbi:platelet glycoprotein Ib alpha chain [Clarias gariepinus]|uniref:platelet glycoprotein Ib alpha chain n=1 Tax=Clarias gariepinus TaxID=13013 RepID=UPI00234C3066|nr:platelet glycoprotein Ib alpha chain [Clarias gariepinus]